MPKSEVTPTFLRCRNRKVRVQVSVRLLGPLHQIHNSINHLFESRIRRVSQAVSGSFDPFGHVAVLEDHPIKGSRFLPCRDTQVFYGVTGLRTFNFVVQCFPLVRNCFLNGLPHSWLPKLIMKSNFHADFSPPGLTLHSCHRNSFYKIFLANQVK
ncbi:hypothetical protein D3C71_1720150 [compost metagenome]